MSLNQILQIAVFLAALLLLAKPLGIYMARVFEGPAAFSLPVFRHLERVIYQLSGVKEKVEQTWREYALGMLLFNVIGVLLVYILQRIQSALPLNPQHLPAVAADSAFNTAISFASNTNWQSYVGESTMSYLTQMLGLSVQNFLSAATGIAILAALARGFSRKNMSTIGNFWVDLTRCTLYILLPLSFLTAIVLVSQGVVQSFAPYAKAQLTEPQKLPDGSIEKTQIIPLGPAASQIAIKQLGTNGGGYFNANSAHPFENPTPLSNFLEMLGILLIPAALCLTFGEMVKDRSQGWTLLIAMSVLFVALLLPTVISEQRGTTPSVTSGNMEGKEVRFGVVNSAIWAVATTAASNGSVNSMHDSFTPLGGLMPLLTMQLGEVVYGGVGSGLYGMIAFALLTVFVSGLMVGRTPEYLGKKVEAFEMKMVVLIVLLPCALTLIGTAAAVISPTGASSISNPSAHGFSQLLYAYTSMSNNNGSAFAGLSANIPFHNVLGGIVMFISRFWLAIAALALAGSLAAKKSTPFSNGTLPTNTPLFVSLLISVVLIVGALSHVPALALGPVAEHLQLISGAK